MVRPRTLWRRWLGFLAYHREMSIAEGEYQWMLIDEAEFLGRRRALRELHLKAGSWDRK